MANTNIALNYCNGCNKGLEHGEQVVIVKNLKFYHFNCYKEKSSTFKFFIPIKNFIVWHDTKAVMQEVDTLVSEILTKLRTIEKFADNIINAQTTASGEQNFTDKIDYALNKFPELKNMNAEFEEIPLDKMDSTDDLRANLALILQELHDLRDKINYFADKKDKDEELIEKYKQQIAYYRKERNDYMWLINYRKTINKLNEP